MEQTQVAGAGSRRLEGKVAIVTGGASGIGLGIVRRVLAEGGLVAAADLSAEALAGLEEELGDSFLGVPTDVRKEEDVAGLVAAAVNRFGALDAAFNAAGVSEGSPILGHDMALWQRQLDVLLTGVMIAVKHEAEQMVSQGNGGAIVNISSINAEVPVAGAAAYCAAKAGVEMLTKTASLELGEHRIRINAIQPGVIETPMAARNGNMVPAVVERWNQEMPLGRIGQPADVAAAAAFLAGPDAEWITGTTLLVDGGLLNTTFPDVGATPLAAD
jgi:NAD(P)-dependent dehydrogenase (short-subunit alcohol dehydrogenase family)